LAKIVLKGCCHPAKKKGWLSSGKTGSQNHFLTVMAKAAA